LLDEKETKGDGTEVFLSFSASRVLLEQRTVRACSGLFASENPTLRLRFKVVFPFGLGLIDSLTVSEDGYHLILHTIHAPQASSNACPINTSGEAEVNCLNGKRRCFNGYAV